jgi:hypothetical protein
MAFSVATLSDWGKEDSLPILTKALFGGETAALLSDAGQVIPGIKYSDNLNILGSTVFFQANGCEPTSSGTTTFTARTLTVGDIQVYETLCPKTLEKKWMQNYMKAGSKQDEVPFAEQIGTEKAALISQALEEDLWQGTVASNQFDGFNTILTALGFGGAGDPIEGNPATGGGYTQLTSLTSSNIDDALAKMYSLAPTAVLKRPDCFIAMGVDTFKLFKQYLVGANLFHYSGMEEGQFLITDPLSGLKVYGLAGLSGTNTIHLSYWGNYYIGTDLVNEQENFEFIYDPVKKNVIFNAEFKMGTQVAFPDQIVYFKLP